MSGVGAAITAPGTPPAPGAPLAYPRPGGQAPSAAPNAAPAQAPLNLRALLEEVIERDASDLHATVGERPMLRIDGHIIPARTSHVLSGKDTLSSPTAC